MCEPGGTGRPAKSKRFLNSLPPKPAEALSEICRKNCMRHTGLRVRGNELLFGIASILRAMRQESCQPRGANK